MFYTQKQLIEKNQYMPTIELYLRVLLPVGVKMENCIMRYGMEYQALKLWMLKKELPTDVISQTFLQF